MPKFKTPQEAFDGSYSLSDLMTLCGLTRGEAAQWVKRGIISAMAETGKGHHREFAFWNLVEASLAKSLSSGFGIQAGQIEFIMQGIRDRLNEQGIGTKIFPYHALFMGDWTASIVPHHDKTEVRLQHGGLGEQNFFPLLATVSIGMVANKLLDSILEDENNGRKGSQNWSSNAFYARRARSIGAVDFDSYMAPSDLTREEPDPKHPGSFNCIETLIIHKASNTPIPEEKMEKIKAFIRDQLEG